MNLTEIRQRLDEERRTVALDSEVIDELPTVARLRARSGSYHLVISSNLAADNADAAIAHEIDHHRRMGVEFEWKLFTHDQPPNLLDRLKAHGFEPGPIEAVLVLDMTNPPSWVSETDTSNVVRIQNPEQVMTDYRQVEVAVFGEGNGSNARELADAVRNHSSQHRGYIAYSAGQPVSIGRLYTHPNSQFGGLYGGGTIPTHRSRGFYRALIAARAKDALHSGARYLLVDALPTSRPILERLGFQHLTDTIPFHWQPANDPSTLRDPNSEL